MLLIFFRECLLIDRYSDILEAGKNGRFLKGAAEPEGEVNHDLFFRDDLGAPGEPPEEVARVAVVALDMQRVFLPYDVLPRRDDLGEGIPAVAVERARPEVLHLVVEPLEGCSITIAEHPGQGLPAAAINGLDEPKLLFFDSTKCHISSNSISRTSEPTSGSFRLMPASRIQR